MIGSAQARFWDNYIEKTVRYSVKPNTARWCKAC